MARGEETKIKVHFKGTHEDFIVFVDDSEVYHQWMSDKSIPLAHFVSTFKVFCTGQQGSQGNFGAPSDGTLDTEFGTSDEDVVIKKILEEGEAQPMDVRPSFPLPSCPHPNSTTPSLSQGYRKAFLLTAR